MATIVPVWTGLPDSSARDGWLITWGPMANGDVGKPITEIDNVSGHADRSVQIEGVFGANGNLAIEGSIDGVNFEILNDPTGTPLNAGSSKIRAILEATRWLRPHATAGDGTTALTVSLFLRKLR